VVAVLVRSAVELPADRRAALEQTLKRRFNITPKIRFEVDPDILGGLWIRLGDTVYDRTVRWNLNRLKANILARKSHEVQG
jgi:F-type H+-transporting ATPase subunit delta